LLEALGPDPAVLLGGEEVATRAEVVAHSAERLQKALTLL
jgi:hypothetical protein